MGVPNSNRRVYLHLFSVQSRVRKAPRTQQQADRYAYYVNDDANAKTELCSWLTSTCEFGCGLLPCTSLRFLHTDAMNDDKDS